MKSRPISQVTVTTTLEQSERGAMRAPAPGGARRAAPEGRPGRIRT